MLTTRLDCNAIWQRMHSAPKNGEDVLLFCNAQGAYVGSWCEESKIWSPKCVLIKESSRGNCSGWIPEPAYWCELPTRFHM